MPGTTREDPIGAFRFKVEIDGLEVAGFSEVSGLEMETELEEYHEGGENGFVYYFPKVTKYPKLVLKHGVISSNKLWGWYKSCASGTIQRKNGSVILYDYTNTEVRRWSFEDAYPVKWAGPDLKADTSAVAVESFELVHKGLTVK